MGGGEGWMKGGMKMREVCVCVCVWSEDKGVNKGAQDKTVH